MSRESFQRNCDTALTRIIERLHAVADEFGPNDFPHDNGTALRNRLCNFAYSFLQVIDFFCYERPEDAWARANGHLVQDAQSGVLYSLTGATHFYTECFKFARAQSVRSEAARLLWPNNSLRISLDWLTNIYAVAPELPIRWHELTTSLQSFDAFIKEADRTLEEAASFELGRPLNRSADSWSGLALTVDLAASSVGAAEWAAQCEEIFAL